MALEVGEVVVGVVVTEDVTEVVAEDVTDVVWEVVGVVVAVDVTDVVGVVLRQFSNLPSINASAKSLRSFATLLHGDPNSVLPTQSVGELYSSPGPRNSRRALLILSANNGQLSD